MLYTADVTLSNFEESSLDQITLPLMKAMALTNDYYSWDKEYDQYTRTNGAMPIVNAVRLLKRLHDVDNTKARDLLRDQILEYEMQYCKLRDEYLRMENPGANAIRYLGLAELGVAGSRFWHATSKRYDTRAPTPTPKTNVSASHFEAIESDKVSDSIGPKIKPDQVLSSLHALL